MPAPSAVQNSFAPLVAPGQQQVFLFPQLRNSGADVSENVAGLIRQNKFSNRPQTAGSSKINSFLYDVQVILDAEAQRRQPFLLIVVVGGQLAQHGKMLMNLFDIVPVKLEKAIFAGNGKAAKAGFNFTNRRKEAL